MPWKEKKKEEKNELKKEYKKKDIKKEEDQKKRIKKRDKKNEIYKKKEMKRMAYYSVLFSWSNSVFEYYHQLSTLMLCTLVDKGFHNGFVGSGLSSWHT